MGVYGVVQFLVAPEWDRLLETQKTCNYAVDGLNLSRFACEHAELPLYLCILYDGRLAVVTQ